MTVAPKRVARPQTLKGFRDYLPADMLCLNYVVERIRSVYERYGFLPVDTPVLEYLATLIGTGGEEINKEIFRLESPEREPIGMRYDLTVPFARLLAQYQSQIRLPFRRYHIGPVFRADKPGPGRYRQFTQFDIDAAGSDSVVVDAEIISAVRDVMCEFGLGSSEHGPSDRGGFLISINNRKLLNALLDWSSIDDDEKRRHVLRVLDKVHKVGLENAKKELASGRLDESGDSIPGVGLGTPAIDKIVEFVSVSGTDRRDVVQRLESVLAPEPTSEDALSEMRLLADSLDALSVRESEAVFTPSLTRGLEYYTGPVYEVTLLDAPEVGSVMGGGRYDKLVDRFLATSIPATGVSIGLDRLIAGLSSAGALNLDRSITKALVLSMRGVSSSEQLRAVQELRSNGIAAEVYLGKCDETVSEQLSYANERSIAVAVILGPDEVQNGTISLKDLSLGKREREGISDRTEYRRHGKAGQVTVHRGDMVASVRRMLQGMGA